jgi:hypothetical protein
VTRRTLDDLLQEARAKIKRVVGGFEAWLAAGLPVTGAPAPGDGLPGMDSPA